MSDIFLHLDQFCYLSRRNVIKANGYPGVCQIRVQFDVVFQSPLPEFQATVRGWDSQQIEERSPALVGGPYLHYYHGEISVVPVDAQIYRVINLAFFTAFEGWRSIVKDGLYAPPLVFSDREYFDLEGRG